MQAWYKRRTKRPAREKSPRTVLIRQFMVGFLLLGVFAAIGAGVWYGTRIDGLTISSVTIEGGETITHEEIRSIASRTLDGAYFTLVPRRFAWTYPREEIIAAIRENGRVKDVQVVRESGTEIHIAFSEYDPAWLWCATMTARPCAFLAEDGYAFTMAPLITGASFARYVDPNRPPKAGEHAFASEQSARFRTFAAGVHDRFGFSVSAIEQLAAGEWSFHLAHGGVLKTAETVSVEETLANLDTILSSSEFTHLRTSPFAYIDLRYGNKVFVMEHELEAQIEPETMAEEEVDETDEE